MMMIDLSETVVLNIILTSREQNAPRSEVDDLHVEVWAARHNLPPVQAELDGVDLSPVRGQLLDQVVRLQTPQLHAAVPRAWN